MRGLCQVRAKTSQGPNWLIIQNVGDLGSPGPNVGAFMIRIGFGGILYDITIINKEPAIPYSKHCALALMP